MKDPRNKLLLSWQVLYLITCALTFLMSCQMTPRDQQEIRLSDIQEDIDNFAIDQNSADSEGESGGGFAEDRSSFSESIDGSNSLTGDDSEEELFIESDQDISSNIPTGDFTKDLDDDSEEINSSTSVNSNVIAGNIDNNSIAGSLRVSGESSISQPAETMVPEAPESSSFDESASFPTTVSQAPTNAPIANDSMNSSSVEDFSDPQFFNQSPAVPTTPPNSEAMVESPQVVSNPEVSNQTGQGLTLSSASLDILPTLHTLTWVGYEIDEKNRELKVEMITKGSPEFRVFQEANRANQVELVIRYFQTDLRRKIRWDIDASEFRSPVAYIRMRGDQGKGFVDVVLTLRDSVKPKFYAKDGDIVLTFPIPERYLGNQRVNNMETVDQAKKLNNIDLVLDIQDGSDLPQQATINRPPALPQQIPEQGASSIPIDEVLEDSSEDVFDDEGFPPSFDSSELVPDSHDREELEGLFPIKNYIFRGQSWGMIAQDDLSDTSSGMNPENPGENALESEILSEIEGQSPPSDAPLMNPTTSNQVPNTMPMNSASVPSSPTFSNPVPSGDQGAAFGAETNFSQVATPPSNNSEPLFGNEGEEIENGFADLATSNDLEGRDSSTAPQAQYNGKLVYMEFTEAPLSIVFKTFSEETGNNFVFPNDVGNLPVTIHFQGVPWDEALKAILETHSLGMVRIGTNVVRVDGIERLTQYMQRLEEAKRFETRRIPTKVLVMRLNNAKAPEILTRLEPIINRDREIDPRIQLSADERTNSIVMEAPEYILAKTKNIIERLDLATPQVEIASRIVEVQKTNRELFGVSWLNQAFANFDPGRGLGFGSLNFPNNFVSNFAVDPGIRGNPSVGNAQFRFGSINKFIDLDLVLRMEERKGTTNILQSNRVLVLDGQKASVLAGNSKFFRPAASSVINPPAGGGAAPEGQSGLAEVKFNLSLEVSPQVTADGSVIMDLIIKSDTPGDPTGEVLADKNTRELTTQMIRENGDTGVIGGIYDTSRIESVTGIPFFSSLPIIGALFRSTITEENQTELLIMVTPTIVSGKRASADSAQSSSIRDDLIGTGSDRDANRKERSSIPPLDPFFGVGNNTAMGTDRNRNDSFAGDPDQEELEDNFSDLEETTQRESENDDVF